MVLIDLYITSILFLTYSGLLAPMPFVIAALLVFCYVAYFLKWLTISGAMAAFLTAIILQYGGLQFFAHPLLLLVGGTLLSKLNVDRKEKHGRNARQVFANGSVGLACLLMYYIFENNVYLEGFLLSFAISIADTFSSEIGKYFKGNTIDIIGFKRMPVGLSGGISFNGTFAGLLGSLLCIFISNYIYHIALERSFLIGLLGFVGMVLDSILGSTLQAKYTVNGQVVEERNNANQLIKGYGWCTNDMVNLLSNVLVVTMFILLKLF